jgi:hypothetical protein
MEISPYSLKRQTGRKNLTRNQKIVDPAIPNIVSDLFSLPAEIDPLDGHLAKLKFFLTP